MVVENPEIPPEEDIPIFAFAARVPKLTIDNVTDALEPEGASYNNLLNLLEDISESLVPDSY